ncbi:acyltransferase family protein [Arthrobacter sp. KFRI-F3372]|nr:acyltransferase family protein [Arthrobacter sp. KFRI-F3372]
MQHYWSLAVEEQFYVVWPWLIVLVLGFAADRLRWRPVTARAVLAGVFASVVVGTFIFAFWETYTNPSVAYFSTISRTWELGIGALLAVCGGAFTKMSIVARTLLGYAGLSGIAWSIVFVTPEMPFPSPWAAVPVLATALVIAAGTGGGQPFLYPLTNRVSGYLGDISYSLYLWHFPVISILAALIPTDDVVVCAAMILGMFALSIASYHFIEDPIRRSSWLEPGRRGLRSVESNHTEKNKYAALGVLTLVTALVVTLALAKATDPVDTRGFQSQPVDILATPSNMPTSSNASKTPTQQLSAEITAALSSTEWPDLTPSVDSLRGQFVPEWKDDKCLDVTRENVSRCVYGDVAADKTVVLLGDSVSISWMPGLRQSLGVQGWKIQSLTKGQCPAIGVSVTRPNNPEGFTEACAAHQLWVLEQVEQMQPDMIVVTSSLGAASLLVGVEAGAEALNVWREATVDRLQALQRISDAQVVLLSPSGQGKNLGECATNFSVPGDCVADGANFFELLQVEQAAAASVPGVRYVSTADWFCTPNRQCPAFAGNTPIFVDGGHITPAYSAKLAPVLGPAILGEG